LLSRKESSDGMWAAIIVICTSVDIAIAVKKSLSVSMV